MLNYIAEQWIEIAGTIISLMYLYFSIKQKIWLWPFGLLSALLYVIVYYMSGFYADMGLQVYYIGVSIYGWWFWLQKSPLQGTKIQALKVRHISLNGLYLLILALLVLWIILWWVLKSFTDSQIPVWDAFTTAGGILGTWMLARKILENWLVWIVVDSVSMILYVWKGLYPTTILFFVYTVLAFIGYRQWKKSMEVRI